MGQTDDGRSDAAVAVTLPWVSLGLALLHLCVIAALPLSGERTPVGEWVFLTVLGVGAAAAQGSVASLARRGHSLLRTLSSQALLAVQVTLLLAHAGLALALTGSRADSALMAVAVVGSGAVLVGVRWLTATLYVAWGTWLVAALAAGGWDGLAADGLVVVAASALAAGLNVLHRHELASLFETRGMADAAAVRDPLTGLVNRRGLALLGSQLLEVARRQGDAVHCVFLDIDGFGRLSAELGDEVGDDILVAVGDALRSVTRTTDVVARWSDDEFAIVGPGPGMAPLELERRVRERLDAEQIVDPRRWDLGITAGGAMLTPWDAGTLDSLLGRADQELNLRRTLRREASPLPRRDPAT